ncbi:Flp pilus assembly protein CpaB [Dyella acidiphila]|uniref:Flp pilus assembly protein CpaB n=1 Tax=Dyella acidiphila TaxID=2775866 RepID=A0ABR9G9V8_9GAMM|nr:Flp pilus assembly protein CpaB [Dyella acidiphila]MBE1160816.1 Flp pilus assembly protein CpaB [Dyella acidiphila]
MQKITRIAAILLVSLAFVLAVLAFSLGRRTPPAQAAAPVATPAAQTAAPQNNGVPVVVATEALPAGKAIAFSALRMATAAQAPPGAFVSMDQVVGRLPLVGIPAGTPITADLLAHGVAIQLMPGERALAVPVDEVAGVGNRIVPGDYVDVFLSLKNPPNTAFGQNHDLSQTRLLLSRLRVLAYGDRNLPVPASSIAKPAAEQTVKNEVAEAARTAVLAVPVADIDQLLLGAQNGKLTLALRYPGDANRPDRQWFPQPPVVLAPLAYLDGEQHQQVHTPDNDAFAGIDGSGLAGQSVALARTPAHRHVDLAGGVEIIRGTQRNDTTGNHSP